MEIEKIDAEIKELKRKIEALERKKKDLLVKMGKGYYCRKCGAYCEYEDEDYNKEQLCYDCWSKEVLEKHRSKWLEIIGGATVVDVEPDPNPFFKEEIRTITLEKNGKKYIVKIDGYDIDKYIVVEDEKGNRVSLEEK